VSFVHTRPASSEDVAAGVPRDQPVSNLLKD
jgi:hypothetical protein